MPYCTNCGNEVDKEEKYCSNCGEQLDKSIEREDDTGKKGNKKLYIILGSVLAVLLIVFLVVNSYVSGILVDQVEEILSTNIEQIERDFGSNIEYSDLAVNAAFGELILNDVVFDDGYDRLDIGRLTLSSSYGNLKKILDSEGDIDEIDKLLVNMKEVSILPYREEKISIDELDFRFDGYLSKEMELNPDLFLDKDHELSIKIQGMAFDFEEITELREFPELAELSNIREMAVTIKHDSKNNQVVLDEIKFSNSYIDANSSVIVNYSGNSFENVELINYEMDIDSELIFKDFSFGDADRTGEYSIDNFLLGFKSSGVYDDDIHSFNWPEGEVTLALEGLNTEFSGEAEQLVVDILQYDFGIWDLREIPELSIEHLNLNLRHDDGQMLFYDTELKSSLFDVGFEFDVDIDELYPDRSPINKFIVSIENFHDILLPLLDEIERDLQQIYGFFPREGDTVILEFEGTLGRFDLKQ